MPGLPGAPGVVQQGNSFTNVPGPTPAATAAGAGIHPTADPRAAVVQAALAGLRANGIIPSQLHATPVANVYEQGGNNFTNANALNAAGVPGPWAPPVPAAAPAPVAAPIAPIAPPVAVVPTVAPAVAAAQASPIETGLSGAWHGLEGGVNALAGGLLAAGGKVTGLPGLTAAGNNLMGVGRAAFDKQNAQTQALHQATGPESYIGQGINELGNYLNPVTAPIYAGMSTANMANGRGGLKTVGGSALAALAAAIPGEELLSAAGHPAESLASSAVNRIAQALGKTATPLAQRIGQVGVSSLLGGASNAAIQVGQNIATRSPTMQGVPEAAALGGVALAGGTAVAHGLGAVVGKLAKKTPGDPFPVDTNLATSTPEAPTIPSAGAAPTTPSAGAGAKPFVLSDDALAELPEQTQKTILAQRKAITDSIAAGRNSASRRSMLDKMEQAAASKYKVEVPQTPEAPQDVTTPPEAPIEPAAAPIAPVAPMVNGDGSPLLESVPDFSQEPGMGEPEAPVAPKDDLLGVGGAANSPNAVGATPAILADNVIRKTGLPKSAFAGKYLNPLTDAAHAPGATHKSTSAVANILLSNLDGMKQISPQNKVKLQNALNEYLTTSAFIQGKRAEAGLSDTSPVVTPKGENVVPWPQAAAPLAPRNLVNSKPRGAGGVPLAFENQVDKALYSVRNPTVRSKSDPEMMAYLRSHPAFQGMDDAAIRQQGQQVNSQVKQALPGVTDKTTPVNIPDSGVSEARPSPVAKAAPAQEVAPESASAQNASPDEPVVAQAAIKNPTDPKEEALVGQSKQGLENIAEDANSKVEQHAAQKMLDKGVVDSKPEPVDTSDIAPLVDTLNDTPKPEAPIAPEVVPSGKPVKASVKKAAAAAAQKALIESNRVKAQAALATRAASKGAAFADPELNKTLNAFQNKQAAYDPSAEPTRAEKDQANALAAKIAAHPEVTKMQGRIHDIREMTDYAPLDASQLKRAIIATRKTFGDRVQTRVADMSQPGRRGETDLEHIYLAAHALHHGLSTFHHEAWHIIREKYLTASERSMMDKSIAPGTRRYKMLEEWGKTHHGPAVQEQIRSNPTERPALYAEALMSGGLPKPTGMVGRLFAKVQNGMDAIKAAVHGAGFNSTDDLVQKGFAGDFKNREHSMSTADANDRIDAEQRGGVPRDVYERVMHGATDEAPRDMAAFDAADAFRPQREKMKRNPLRIARIAKYHVARQLSSFTPPSTLAHMHPEYRRLFEASEAKSKTVRHIAAEVAATAHGFFPEHSLDALKYRDKDVQAASDMLDKANRRRKVFSPEELAKSNLSAKGKELYNQFNTALGQLADHTAETKYVGLNQHLNMHLDELDKADEEVEKQQKLAEENPENPAAQAALAKALELQDATKAYIDDIHDKMLKVEDERAYKKSSGYYPELRDGSWMGHAILHYPKAYDDLTEAQTMHNAHTAAMDAAHKELGISGDAVAAIDAMPAADFKARRDAYKQAGGTLPWPKAKKLIEKASQSADELPMLKAAMQDAHDEMDAPNRRMTFKSFDAEPGATPEDARALIDQFVKSSQSVAAERHGSFETSLQKIDAPEGQTSSDASILRAIHKALESPDTTPEQRLAFLRQVADNRSSLFNRFAPRKDVGGADNDPRTALSRYTSSVAEFGAATRHRGEMEDAYDAIKDPKLKDKAADYLSALAVGNAHADKPAQVARQIVGLMYLGGQKVGPGLYALLQNSGLAHALLSKEDGHVGAVSRFGRALNDVTGISPLHLKQMAEQGKGVNGMSPQEVKDMYAAHLDGSTGAQYAHLVQGGANGQLFGGRKSAAAVGSAMKVLGAVESSVRGASYLSFLRQHRELAAKGIVPHTLAMDEAGHTVPQPDERKYALDMTNAANQNYNKEDTIPGMTKLNGDLSTLLEFLTPSLRILNGPLRFLAHTNKPLLAKILGAMVVAGGYEALPGAQNIEQGYNGLSSMLAQRGVHIGPLGNGLSASYELNHGIKHILGDGVASHVIMHGALSMLPGGEDFSPYIGLGDQLGPIPNLAGKGLAGVAGTQYKPFNDKIPVVSAAEGVKNTIADLTKGDWKAAAMDDPVSSLKDITEGIEALRTGQITNRENGSAVPMTKLQAIGKILGLEPTKVAEMYNAMGQKEYQANTREGVQSTVDTLYQHAIQDGNPLLRKEATQIMQSWNKTQQAQNTGAQSVIPDYAEIIRKVVASKYSAPQKERMFGVTGGRGMPHPGNAAE